MRLFEATSRLRCCSGDGVAEEEGLTFAPVALVVEQPAIAKARARIKVDPARGVTLRTTP